MGKMFSFTNAEKNRSLIFSICMFVGCVLIFFAIAFLLRMLFLNKITIEAIPVMLSGVLLIFGCGLLFSSPFREKVEISPRVAVVFLLTTVVVGTILRVMLAVWLAPELNSDYLEYHRNALYILEGDFRDSYTRPLGYPALVALIYLILPDPLLARLVNALLGAFFIIFVYLLGKEFFEKKGIALAGAWFAAFFPTQIFMTGLLCTEIISTTIFTGALWLFVRWVKSKKVFYLVLSGFMIGVGLLFRSSLLFHLPWMIVTLIVLSPVVLEKIRNSAIFIVAILVVQFGFLGWYAIASGGFSFVPLENNVGDYMLLSGTNLNSKGYYNQADADLYWSWPEEERTQLVIETAIKRITSQPMMFLVLILRKMLTLFSESYYGAFWVFASSSIIGFSSEQLREWYFATQIMEQSWFVIILILIWGYAFVSKLKPNLLFACFGMALICTAIPHVLLESQSRYSNALLPFYSVLAGAGLWMISGRLSGKVKSLHRSWMSTTPH